MISRSLTILVLIFCAIAISSTTIAMEKPFETSSAELNESSTYSSHKDKRKKKYRQRKDTTRSNRRGDKRNARVSRRNRYKYRLIRKNRRKGGYRYDHQGRRSNSFRY